MHVGIVKARHREMAAQMRDPFLHAAHAQAHARAASDAVARLLPNARRAGAEDVAQTLAALG